MALQQALEEIELQEALGPSGNDISTRRLLKELDTLLGQPFFDKYNHSASIEMLDLSQAFKKIESTAPTWAALLLKLMGNRRQEWDSYKGLKNIQPVQQRAYLITSIICRCRGRDTANYFAKTMSVYLLGSGVKRRVLEVLAGLGVCDGYKYANRLLTEIAQDAKEGIYTYTPFFLLY